MILGYLRRVFLKIKKMFIVIWITKTYVNMFSSFDIAKPGKL